MVKRRRRRHRSGRHEIQRNGFIFARGNVDRDRKAEVLKHRAQQQREQSSWNGDPVGNDSLIEINEGGYEE